MHRSPDGAPARGLSPAVKRHGREETLPMPSVFYSGGVSAADLSYEAYSVSLDRLTGLPIVL